jgi:hypothetical protein
LIDPTASKAVATLNLICKWQTSHDEQNWRDMSKKDTLVFLQKGLTALDDLTPIPTSRSITADTWALEKHSPRPLDSYGFLVDFLLRTKEAEPCIRDIITRFYEPQQFFQKSFDPSDPMEATFPALKFDVPKECLSMIPTFQSFEYTGEYLEAIVYVADKTTGLQAKLFQGTLCGFDQEGYDGSGRQYFMLGGFDDYHKFDASTFFAGRSDKSNFGCIPETTVELYLGANSAELVLYLSNRYDFTDGGSSSSITFNTEAEIVAFFEKGLSWGEYSAGYPRGNQCPGF